MKLGFLTDSFPVEFLNQVNNKRKKKRLRRKVHVGILILEIVYVALESDNVDFMVMLKIANLRTLRITNL